MIRISTKYKVAIVIFMVIFLLSSSFLAFRIFEQRQQEQELMELAEIVRLDKEKIRTETPEEARERRIEAYKNLQEKNSDFKGWIYIAGTKLDYPVMYTPKEQEYYLRRNFNRQYSVYGIPFLSSDCTKDLKDDNILIYGHYVKNGNMFGSLEEYKDKEYFDMHRIISFDTIDEFGEYEVLSVFVTTDSEEGFPYYKFINASDEEDYDKYINEVKKISLYETGITATYGEKLLTLSTCDYSQKNGRLVIVAKKTSV